MNWVENLSGDERKILNVLAGSLGLPMLSEYENKVHFLTDVYARIVEAKAMAGQAYRSLSGEAK